MKISARNQILGKIVEVKKGPVNSEVIVTPASGEKIVSVITNDAVEMLGLKAGSEVVCMVAIRPMAAVRVGDGN